MPRVHSKHSTPEISGVEPAKTLGVSAQECKVISTWRNGAIGAFQFGMIFTNSKIIRVARESLYYNFFNFVYKWRVW